MASLYKPGSAASYCVGYKNVVGQRKQLNIGVTDKSAACEIKRYIERLLDYQSAGRQFPPEVSRWVAGIFVDLRDRLVDQALLNEHHRTLDQLVEIFEK